MIKSFIREHLGTKTGFPEFTKVAMIKLNVISYFFGFPMCSYFIIEYKLGLIPSALLGGIVGAASCIAPMVLEDWVYHEND